MAITLHIARDFSRFPAGRHMADGPYSGQRFREEFLVPALKKGPVELLLDDVAGLPSSFLEEVIGGLIRSGFPIAELKEKLSFKANSPRMKNYPQQALQYLKDAETRLNIGIGRI